MSARARQPASPSVAAVAAAGALLGCALIAAAPARAEEPGACVPGRAVLLDGLTTPEADLARLVELAGAPLPGSGMIRRAGAREVAPCEGAMDWSAGGTPAPAGERWVRALPLRLDATWNSAYPSGRNDGLLWAGRGTSARLSPGVAGRWGAWRAALQPEVAWEQNRWFETQPTGRPGDLGFANPWYGDGLDLPQRPGAGPRTVASLGQSYLRVDAFGAGAGLSTESVWLGPGLRDALVLTDEAPGFPHLFLGTSAPAWIGVGRLEALALWGRLDRTRWTGEGGHPWFSALALAWEPRWVPGLWVGAARAFVETGRSLRSHAGLSVLLPPTKQWSGGDNPSDNQVATLWLRWVFPEAGLELYGEWGRDDFPVSLAGLTREPERTQGWVWGLQKLFRAGPRVVRLQVEASRFHEARPLASASGLPVWYVHGRGLGWTHDGQLLGAATGPGGDAQSLAVDLLGPGGRVGGFLERTRRNEEIYWSIIEPGGQAHDHDAELAAGVRQVLRLGPVELSWRLAAAYRWSRDFLRNEPNLSARVELAIPLGGFAAGPAGGAGAAAPPPAP